MRRVSAASASRTGSRSSRARRSLSDCSMRSISAATRSARLRSMPPASSSEMRVSMTGEAPPYPVFGALRIDEVPAIDPLCRLKLAIDAAVALFEAARVPGEVDVKQVVAIALQVQSLARRVGCDQDAQRIVGRRRVERALDLLPAIGRG